MKNIIKRALLALSLLAILFVTSCNSSAVSDIISSEYKVTCVFGDEREDEVLTVSSGKTLTIKEPTRDGYVFIGWCTDRDRTNFFDFNKGISSSITLYAKWDFDYKAFLSDVSEKASASCVKVTSYSSISTSNQGSGVVYKSDESYYYALTNSHVVSYQSGNLKPHHYVYDVYGNQYSATVIKNDPQYDLAVLKFKRIKDIELGVAEFDVRIPGENERVVMVSAPNGKYNTVALGDVAWYSSVDTSKGSGDKSAVEFEVLWIDGDADHGSSGGAVFDENLKLVGIIYATVNLYAESKDFVLAIPTLKIGHFLADIEY